MSGVNPKVPVFSIISFGLNNWVLGGYSPNYRQQGPDMAKQAINIEKGEEANIKFIPNEYIFDFNKIKESDIPIEKLPRILFFSIKHCHCGKNILSSSFLSFRY